MKKIIYLGILILIPIIAAQAQSSNDEVTKTLNNYRKNLKLREFKHDTLMQKGAVNIFKSPHYGAIISSDDSIRKYLRNAGCYDYNIKLIPVKTSDCKTTGLRNYKTLAAAVRDSGYNSTSSVTLPETGKTYILLSKKYLSIERFEIKLPLMEDNKIIPEEPYIGLMGKTSLKGFYYQIITDSVINQPKYIDTQDGNFKVPVNGKYKSVILKGTDNQILSIYENN
jgi:hypothetical protein